MLKNIKKESLVTNVTVKTFGCRLNSYESQLIRESFSNHGKKKLDRFHVINTCNVTNEAVRQARQAIRKIHREYPENKILVTGCAAQIAPELFAKMPEVDLVIGNREKIDPDIFSSLVLQYPKDKKIFVKNIFTGKNTYPPLIRDFHERSRAFLQVQQGCDYRCTFCVIPFSRGNSFSIPYDHIFKQIQIFLDKGFKEIILTGVDLTSYGKDLKNKLRLGDIVEKILYDFPELKRLRISSLDPAAIDSKLKNLLISEDRIMPHVHLSIQSGDNIILKRMKRRHSREQVIELCSDLIKKRKGITFGADLIVGFPTETENMFQNTLKIVSQSKLTFLHIFPFSPRSGTPASKMPQVSGAVVKERLSRLRDMSYKALRFSMNSLIGKKVSVLLEKEKWGRCEFYFPVKIDKVGKIGNVLSASITDYSADGELEAKVN